MMGNYLLQINIFNNAVTAMHEQSETVIEVNEFDTLEENRDKAVELTEIKLKAL